MATIEERAAALGVIREGKDGSLVCSTPAPGIYQKFTVMRTDGSSEPGGKHAECNYFVLDFVHDKYSTPAALAYAYACESEHPELAADLRRWAQWVKR